MNDPSIPEVLLHGAEEHQPWLPLATQGAARWVWQSRFGSMLIEVFNDAIFVNGQPVQTHVTQTQGLSALLPEKS